MKFGLISFLSAASICFSASLCPSNLTQLEAQSKLDSATVERYPVGIYAVALGESSKSISEAKNNARLELVKQLNSQISSVLKIIEQNGKQSWSQSETTVQSSFDQAPLLRSDADLVCKGDRGYIAEAHLKLEDYLLPLKMNYEDSAIPFRSALNQALAAKDKEHFNAAFTRASNLRATVIRQGKYLLAVLAEASRGQSVDISAVLAKNPLPVFEKDMALWQKVASQKESQVNELVVGLKGYAQHAMPVITEALANFGVTAVQAGKSDDYTLVVTESESGYEGNFGGVFNCEVELKVDLLSSKGKKLGSKPLRSKDWKRASVGDSTEVCAEAWQAVTASTMGEQLKPLIGAYLPVR